MVLSAAGRIVHSISGRERVPLLLALEVSQSQVDDDWCVTRGYLEFLTTKSRVYDQLNDEPGFLRGEKLASRLAAMGVVYVEDWDGPQTQYISTSRTHEILDPILADDETPLMHFARALIADDKAVTFGDRTGETATRLATRQARMIAHEVRNSVIPMRMALARLTDRTPADKDLDRLVHGLERIEKFVDEMAETAKLSRDGGTFAVGSAARDAVAEASAGLGSEADLTLADDLHVEGDRSIFTHSLLNILRNAWQIEPKAIVTVRVTPSIDGRRVRVVVDDDGPGVPENARLAIFDDGVGFRDGGSGQGLAFARRAVEDMRGRLSCEASPAGGARFIMDLPVAGGDA